MTNLEREMKLKMLDEEELEFQRPIEDDDFDFEVLDDDAFIIETVAETAPKSPKKDSKTQSSTKDKKMAKQATENVSATHQTKDKSKKEAKKNDATEKTPEKESKQTIYQEGTEPPIVKITPVAEQTETTETDSFEQTAKTTQSTTEEFEYEEAAPAAEKSTEETLEGEVEEKAQTVEFTDEARQSHREFAETSSNVFSIKDLRLGQWNWVNTAKQIGSLVAVLAVFIICFQSYGYYIEKNAKPIDNQEVVTVATNAKETVAEKTSETLTPYKKQAEEKKAEMQTTTTTTTAKTSQESNLVKIDKIIARKNGQNEQSTEVPAEEAQERFATLKDLTKYINDNTLLLYDILENTEEKYAAGTITIEEYSRTYTEAKEKLQELSTLLTTNENVYIEEQQSGDYNVLIENINTLNDTY